MVRLVIPADDPYAAGLEREVFVNEFHPDPDARDVSFGAGGGATAGTWSTSR